MIEVVGIKNVVAKSTGVKYVEFHCLSEDKFVTGKRADAIFVREDMVENLDLVSIGCQIAVTYNRFGRVECVSVLG